MSHTVTGKLNNDANEHPNQSGVTFFVRLGEKNYNFKTKEAEWTNYEAAVFVKENQAQFYRDALVAGAIVTIGGKGLIVENDPQYGVKLHVQDARIEYAFNPNSAPRPATQQQAPQYQGYQQQAPQQQTYQQPQAPQQQAPQRPPQAQNMAPPAMDQFDSDIPFS